MKHLIKPIVQVSTFVVCLSVAIAAQAKPNESDGPRHKKEGYSSSHDHRSKQHQNNKDHKQRNKKQHAQARHKPAHHKQGNHKKNHHGVRWANKHHQKYHYVQHDYKHHNRRHASARFVLDGYGDCYKQQWYNGYRVFKKVRQYKCFNE